MDNAVSNIFAISGFDRINWLRFIGNLENTYNAFTDLLERDIASIYFKREISYGPNHADDENDSELWVFLFSGSLPELSSLTQLIKKESGTLKFSEGATHEGDEARISLLFGALKNLVQKVLHQNSFVRVSDFFLHLPDELSRAIDPSLLIFRDDECLDSITIKFFLMGGVICCYVSAFKTRLQQLDTTELKAIMTQAQNKSTWNKHVLTSTTGAIGQIKTVVEAAEELTSQSKSWTEHLSHQNHALSQYAVKVQVGNSTFTFPSGLVFKIAPLRLAQSKALLEQFYAYEYAQRNDATVALLNNGFKSLSVNSKDAKFRKEVNFWKYKDPFLNLDSLPAPAVPVTKPKAEVKNQPTPKPEEDDSKRKVEEPQPAVTTTAVTNPEPVAEVVVDSGNNNASTAAPQPNTAQPAPPPTQPAAPTRPRLIFTAKKKSQSQQGTSAQPTTAAVPPPITEMTPTPVEQKPAEPMVIETKFPMEKDTFDFDISKGLGNDDFDEWMMEIDKEKPKPKPVVVEPVVVTKMEIDTHVEPFKPEPILATQPALDKSNSFSMISNPPTVPLAASTEEIAVTRNNSTEALLTAKQKQRTLYGLCPPDYQSLNNAIPKVSLKSSLTYTPANSKVTKSDLLSYSADPKSEMSDSNSKQGNSDPKLGDLKEHSSMLDNISSDESDSESSSDSDSDEEMVLDNPFDRDHPMDEFNGDSSNPPPFTPDVKPSDVIKGNVGNKSSPLPHFELINPISREDRGPRGSNLITQLLSSRYRPVTAVKLTYVLDALNIDLHALDIMQHFKHYFSAYTPQHVPSFGSVGHSSLTPQHTPYSLQVHSPGLYNQMSPTSQPSPSQFPRNPSTPSNAIKTPHTPGMTPIPYIKSNTPPGTQFALRDTQLQRLIEVIEQQALIGYDVSFDNENNVGVLVDRAAQFMIEVRQQRQNWTGIYSALRDIQVQEEPNSWLLELILDPISMPLTSNRRLTDHVQSLLTNSLQNMLRNTKSSIECKGPLSFNDWSLIGGGDKLVRALINNSAPTNNATPANPFVEELKEPKFLVGYQEEWLEVPPKLLPFWEKANLEPYAPKKNVAYFVITPDNQFLLNQVITFFNELSAIYELCNLGKHKAAQTSKFGEGIVFAPDMADSEDIISAEVKYNYASQFVESCKNLANHLCEDSVLNVYSDSCIVVYIVFPFDHVTKSPATQQNQALLYKCLASIAEITAKKGNLNLILQPIPISHVIDKRADSNKVKSLCFSVFNKSRRVTVMTNKSNHTTPSTPTMSSLANTSFKLFEPSAVLAPPNGLPEKSVSDMPELFLDSKPAGSSQSRDYFHFCYTASDYGDWTAICCTDARGEFLEARLLKTQRDMHEQASQLWSLCNKLLPLKRWHVIITKYGEFLPNELQEWQQVLSGPDVAYSDIILSVHVASITFNRELQFIFDTAHNEQLANDSFAFYPPHPTCHFDTSTVRPRNMNSLHSPATPSTPGNVPPSPPHVTRPLISAYLVAPTAIQSGHSSLCPAQTVLFARLYLEHGRAEYLPNMHHVIRDFVRECWALSWLDGPVRHSILPLHAAVAKRLARLSSVLQFFKVT